MRDKRLWGGGLVADMLLGVVYVVKNVGEAGRTSEESQ